MTETAAELRDNGDGSFGKIAMAYTHHGKDSRGRDAGIEGCKDQEDGRISTWEYNQGQKTSDIRLPRRGYDK